MPCLSSIDRLARRCAVVIAVAIALPTALPAHAGEEDPATVPRMVVTAARGAVDVFATPSIVSVIDRAQIEARQPSSMVELLRHLPGLHVVEQGGRGGLAELILRGAESNFTVVLLDGVQVNDSTNTRGGSFDFTTLDVATVERIEIVRGPLSALYGSDALGGAINIITRGGGAELAASYGASLGTDSLWDANLALSGPAGPARFAATLATDDAGDAVEGSHFDSTTLHGRLDYELDAKTDLSATLRVLNAAATSFPEDSGGPRLAVIRDLETRDIDERHLGAEFKRRLAQGHFDVRVGRYERDENQNSPGIAPGAIDPVPPNGAATEFRRSEVSTAVRWVFNDSLAATAGAEWLGEDGASRGFLDLGFVIPTDFSISRDTTAVFTEIDLSLGEHLVAHGGLRYDDPEGFGSETTTRLGVLWRIPDTTTDLRLNWGEAFKIPSFFALAHPLVGNPTLKPERGESWDLGLSQTRFDGRLRVGVAAYRNDFRDLVDFDALLFTNVNRSKVRAEGGEFEFEVQPTSNLSVGGHLTYTDVDVLSSRTELRWRPQWRGGLLLDWSIAPRWRLHVDWLDVDEFYQSSVPTGGQRVAGYSRLDATLHWDQSPNLSWKLAVENLTDESYEEAIGFPSPGRQLRLILRGRTTLNTR